MPPTIPESVARRWRFKWRGADGLAVVADAACRLDEAVDAWSLEKLVTMPDSYWGATFAAVSFGRAVVVKINPRTPDGLSPHCPEPRALADWARAGIAPAVLATLHGEASYLMERCQPGTTLLAAETDVTRMVALMGDACRAAHIAADKSRFTHLTGSEEAAAWRAALAGTREATLLDSLLSPGTNDVLLHLDLHCTNVLRAGDGWRIIDPIPHVGDPNADIYALIFNPPLLDGMPNRKRAATHYIDRHLSSYIRHAGLDFDRARAWLCVRGLYRIWRADRERDGEDLLWTSKLGRLVELLSP